MGQKDPYAKYGGSVTPSATGSSDPYAKYGGQVADTTGVLGPDQTAPNAGLAPPAGGNKNIVPARVVAGPVNAALNLKPETYDQNFNPVTEDNKPVVPSLIQRLYKGTAGNAQQGLEDLGVGDFGDMTSDTSKPVGPIHPIKAANHLTKAALNYSAPLLPVAAAQAPIRTAEAIIAANAGSQAGEDTANALGADPDTQEFVGNLAGLGAGAGMVKATKPKVPMTSQQAVSKLRFAVNPNLNDAPGFLNEMNQHLDSIVREGQNGATTPQDLQSLAATTKAVADAHPYYKTFIEPYAGEDVSTSQIPNYQGNSVDYGRARIGDLNARLKTINATLNPRFARGPAGSTQQVAAVSAQEAGQLQAEAAGIRNTLASEISKRTGVPAATIAAQRAPYGQLADLADTMQQYANEATAKSNANAKAPLTLNPLAHNGKVFVLDKALNYFRGDPTNNAIADVFANYDPGVAPPQPQITPPAPKSSRQRLTPQQMSTVPPNFRPGGQSPAGGGSVPSLIQSMVEGGTPSAPSSPAVPSVVQGASQTNELPTELSRVLSPNASGESPASLEALSRNASERSNGITRVRIDTRSGRETPLIGVDAVDVRPGPYDRIVMRSQDGEQTLAEGAHARPAAGGAPTDRVWVQHKSGQVGTISRGSLAQALASGDYKLLNGPPGQ